MKLLITGICGFVGTSLAKYLRAESADWEIHGLDNFIRPGSERNRLELKRLGVKLRHADLRAASDFETLPAVDAVIDAAANASVLAGIDGSTSSRQLIEHNLSGTINLLEYCKTHQSTFLLLSTSRVYSIPSLADLPVVEKNQAFVPDGTKTLPLGLSSLGLDESFSTRAPVSLYGSTKLASETLALEYGEAFGFPVWIDRCGVLAGAGQFGRPDQGIFAYWLHSWKQRRPLRYIGFGGNGYQVRDCFHPDDLARLVMLQLRCREARERIVHVSGGQAQAMSLRQLSGWCEQRWGAHEVTSDPQPRPFDLPWVVLDSRRAGKIWNWTPKKSLPDILEEIAVQAEKRTRMAGAFLTVKPADPTPNLPPLRLLSVIIPARDEEGCICSTVEHLHVELRLQHVPHEIIVVDDGSKDRTWPLLVELQKTIPELHPQQNSEDHGFGRAIVRGLDAMQGDAAVIMMADESDDCRDVAVYWRELNRGFDCVFGSRFIRGGGTIDYPAVKWFLNRLANAFIASVFRVHFNDTTNAFKAYRKTVIDGCRPLLSPHFNLTVELPLKAIVRGYTWTTIPITWRNRRTGVAKLKIKEMGSRYFFICMYVLLEKYFSRGDYKRKAEQAGA